MTKASPHAAQPAPGSDYESVSADLGFSALPGAPVRLGHSGLPSALWTLFVMELDRQCRARRMLLVLVLFALPVAFAVLFQVYNNGVLDPDDVELYLIFYFIPNVLVPLTALLYATGMIHDEVEEQTLTYLLVRPLPKWLIYVAKLMATLLVTSALVGVFTMATDIAIFWGKEHLLSDTVLDRGLKTTALVALCLVAYGSLFGGLSLMVKRTMAVGVAYIVVFEGVIANIDFVARWITVMYYFRVLSERWLDLHVSDWSIDLSTAPEASACVWILLGASLVITVVAAITFTVREFRVKTPEGT